MKKISSKQIFTGVILVGVIVLVIVYVTVYKKYTDMAEALKASNATLEKRVDSLKKYYDDEKKYLADMGPLEDEINKILEPYIADTKEEDIIMQAVHTQMIAPIVYSNVNIGDKSVIKRISAETVTKAGLEEYENEIAFVEQGATYSNQVTYEGLKMAITSLFDSEYMIGIRSITYSAGQEDLLSGSLDLAFYSVRGTGKEYKLPEILPYANGTENIFGISEK